MFVNFKVMSQDCLSTGLSFCCILGDFSLPAFVVNNVTEVKSGKRVPDILLFEHTILSVYDVIA